MERGCASVWGQYVSRHGRRSVTEPDGARMTAAPGLYLVCGKIAAGKTTLARTLAARPAMLLVSEDHWTSNLFGPELRTFDDYIRLSARLRAAMGPHIVAVLGGGLSVVLDFPANTLTQRAWMRSIIEAAQVPHELHVLAVPDSLCLERLHARNATGKHPFHVSDADFAQFTRHYQAPTESEGFNLVVHTG
jgi:predicted kinase